VAACPPPLVVETGALAMMMAMLVESAYITLLPRSQLREDLRAAPAPSRVVRLSDAQRLALHRGAQTFAEHLRDECATASACERSRHALP
jgi:DNA-binding transcriptional LysR family regulator